MSLPDPSDEEVIDSKIANAGLAADRYVSVQNGKKRCLDHDTRYDSPPEGNYGVYCDADDRLVVLDVDDYDRDGINAGLAAVEALPETLEEQSPHGGTHYYYRVEMADGRMPSAVLDDELGVKNPCASWGEVQVANKYVLAAGNELDECKKDWHDCSEGGEGHYEVTNDAEIATIDAETLVEVLCADAEIERERDDPIRGEDESREDGSATGDWIEQRVEKARSHDDTLDALMDGDYSDFRNKNGVDRSKAESSLASRLAFWLEGDAYAVEQVIEHDARTKKWDERGDSYRDSVLEAAEKVTTYYDAQSEITVEHASGEDEVANLSHEERLEQARDSVQRIIEHYEGGEEIEFEIGKPRLRERVANVLKHYWTWVYPSGGEEAIMGWADEVLYCRDPGTGVYRMNGASMVDELVEELLGHLSDDATVREITNKVARKSYTGREEIKAREPPENHVVVGNGVVDLETGELLDEIDPDTLYRHRVPVDYRSDAECEYIDARFGEWVSEDYVETLYRIAAHTIYPGYPTKRIALLPGEGDNGKGMYLDTINALVGEQNAVHRGLGDLSDYRFAMEDLEGKLANLEGDLSPEEIQDTGVLKKLTGGDPVTADIKQQSSVKFRNKATLVAAVNTVPELPEDNHAIWRRWLYIPFASKFVGDEKIPGHVLRSNLTSEDELEGLLARAIDELCEWWQNDNRDFYPNADSPGEVREQMMNAANPVRDFATTVFDGVETPENPPEGWSGKTAAYGKVLKSSVVDAYEQYAEEENVPRMASQKLKDEIGKLAAYDIDGQRQTRALAESSDPKPCFVGVEWTSRGAQLAGVDHPDKNDAQDALNDVDGGELAPGVTVGDVREYVAENPDEDVYAVLREFELGGDAFDAVEQVVENTPADADESHDDDNDRGGGATSDDGGDDGGGSTDDAHRTQHAENKRDSIENAAEELDEPPEEVAELLCIRREDEDEVAEIVEEVRDNGDEDPPAPPEPTSPPTHDGVPSREEDDSAIDYDVSAISDEDETVVTHGEAGCGVTDPDVVVIRESDYTMGVELAYSRDTQFVTPDGESIGDSR